MSFYLMKITQKNGEDKVRSVFEYETADEAVMNFHHEIDYAMGTLDYILIMVLDEFGNLYDNKKERWERVIPPEPEPEPEPEPIPEEPVEEDTKE